MSPRTRYYAAGLLALATLGGPFTVGPFSSEGSDDVRAEVVVSLQDDDIDESSGLVVRGDRLFTVNDSGGDAVVYEVDLDTGATVGRTTFAEEEPTDIEALAPGRGGTLWVGDIGDNRRARASIRLYRFQPPPGGGTVRADTFDLVYPDGPHDAETLLVHPRTGRVLVVTKQLLGGGAVYRAPRRLVPGDVHRLERIGRVPGLLTDGAFLPGGRRLVLRSYGAAAVYTYPDLEQVASAVLPRQEQGEGLAVGDDGRLYLSTEGAGSDVLRVDVPKQQAQSAPAMPQPSEEPAVQRREYDPEPWLGLGVGPFLLLASGVGVVLGAVRAALRRTRGRR